MPTLDPHALLPPGEEMAPDLPTEALSRYVALLMRWDVLSRRQRAYDEERAQLEARGAALEAEWADVRLEHAACLPALQACHLPLDVALREAWMRTKAHWTRVVEPNPTWSMVSHDSGRHLLKLLNRLCFARQGSDYHSTAGSTVCSMHRVLCHSGH